MAVRQEAPVRRGPVIRTPEKRGRGVRNALAVTAAATGLAVAGLLGYEVYKNSQQAPEPTPIAGGIGEPTPSPEITPEITIFLSPSPEITPTLTSSLSPEPSLSPTPEITSLPTPDISKWWNQIPENPYKSINEVPLAKDSTGKRSGGLIMMEGFYVKPYYVLGVRAATLAAVIPNPEKNTILIALITGDVGSRIGKNNCEKITVNDDSTINFCQYTKATIWLELNQRTKFFKSPGEEAEWGVASIADNLKVGTKVRAAYAYFSVVNDIYNKQNAAETKLNISSFRKLNSSVGKIDSRTNQNFLFHASALAMG